MGIFAGAVGKLKGDSAGVFAFAETWKAYANDVLDVHTSLSSSGDLAPTWSGRSRLSYDNSVGTEAKDLVTLVEGAQEAASALETYGWALSGYEEAVEELRALNAELDSEYEALNVAEKVTAFFEFSAQAKVYREDYLSYVTQAQAAATECAARLREALHIEAGVPEGQGTGRRSDLTPEEMEAIAAYLASDQVGYNDIRQRQIGDCYYLATIMALADSEEGRQILRDSIKLHYGPDGKPDGFMVTVYDDPLNPSASATRTVFVDDVYNSGVVGPDGKPNYASILESAYGQNHPGGTLPDTEGGISNGGIWEADQDLTNNKGRRVMAGSGYSTWQRIYIIAAANGPNPVTAETANAPRENFPDNDTAWVPVTMPDGSTSTIQIYGSHAYMIVDADTDGVTIANPHGYNTERTDDGPRRVDGTFTMSWEDYNRYYSSTEIGSVK